MAKQSQSGELAAHLIKLRPGTAALAPKVARALVRHAKALHRLYEHRCNRELTLAEQSVEIRHERWVERLCATVTIKAKFNGDPRGFPVKLHFGSAVEAESECPNCHNGTVGKEDGRLVCRGECGAFLTDEQPYNTWGGASEGWGIG